MQVTGDVMTLFILLFGIIAVESIILLLAMIKTPMMTFLKASIFKKPIIYILGKDRIGEFKTFKPENGAGKVGKDGIYDLTENSHTLEKGSKLPLYFAFRDQAASLQPEYPAIIQQLREKGFKISNIEDLDYYIDQIKRGVMEDVPVKVQPYKTYRLHDLQNMFPYNTDPTFIDATVQSEVSKGLKLMKMGPKVMGSVIMLVMVSAIAVFIVQRAFKGCVSPDECEAFVKAASCTKDMFNNVMANASALK